MIENLQEELALQQHKLVSANKRYQGKIESLMQQAHTATLQDFPEEIHLLKQELETSLKRLHQVVTLQAGAGSTPYVPPAGQLSEEEYSRVVQVLEEETDRLRTEVGKIEEEKLQILKSNVELKKRVSTFEAQYDQEKQRNNALRSAMDDKEMALEDVKASFTALTSKFTEQSEDLRTLLAQTEALHKSKDHLSKILLNVKDKLKEAQKRVAESVRIAEDALVEKDAALLREKHALNEVCRLETTVSSLTEEAGKKAQAEVSKIKDDYNTSIKKMSQEVMNLEMALNEKQLEFERSMRELKKVTNEAEQIQGELNRKRDQHHQEIVNFQDHINSLEAKILTLSVEKDNMCTTSLQIAQENEHQREELLMRISELEERLTSSRTECAAVRLECEEVKRNYNTVSALLNKVKEDSEATEKFLKRQLRLKTEELEDMSATGQARLDASDSAHRDAVSQMYENTAVIQENYSKFQSHVSAQKIEFEQRITDLKHCLEESKKKNQQLTHSLHEANTNLAVAKDIADQISEVEHRLHAAERRFATVRQKNIPSDGTFR
ncbi:Sodium channel and clathrin linker 1-like [Homarus americanus]|uniref:Sodium channel and clathrin linker 1-like n=1 Tax=Homarus americanus TaxID=6706 RepID=A0A8J5K1E5_HOMAM|nr:Sodium channel and clathrin linker 1-like [Homarus americanus]